MKFSVLPTVNGMRCHDIDGFMQGKGQAWKIFSIIQDLPPTIDTRNNYCMRIEPVSAVDLLPMAALITLSFLDALITVDFDTFEPSTVIEPTEAFALLPMAALITFLFFDALIIVDFETLDPSAIAEKEVVAAKVKTSADTKVFMFYFLCGFVKRQVQFTVRG